jgi:hypothetical protein
VLSIPVIEDSKSGFEAAKERGDDKYGKTPETLRRAEPLRVAQYLFMSILGNLTGRP